MSRTGTQASRAPSMAPSSAGDGIGLAYEAPHHEEDTAIFLDISELQTQGIGAADIAKLRSNGIATAQAVSSTTKKTLGRIKGLGEIKAEKIKDAAGKLIQTGFSSGIEISRFSFLTSSSHSLLTNLSHLIQIEPGRQREKTIFISTGSKSLDSVLGGGIFTSSISEVYGEIRTGKTQICSTTAVTCQLPQDLGGANGKVAWVDTEGTFRPERIRSIARRFGLDEDATLSNIVVGRALNSDHQMDLITLLAAKFAEEGCYRLLIVDSIMALFRTDYSGRGELSERQQRLNQMLSRLTRIAEEFHVAVLLVNQVQSDPGGGMAFAAAEKKPLGEHVLPHASTTRLYLRKGRGDERVGKVVDSPDVAEAEGTYRISEGGVEDVA